MKYATTSSWSDKVVIEEVLGHPCRVFAERPGHLGELLSWGAQHGDRTCLVQGQRRLSFAQLPAAIETVAGALSRQGLQPGDRVLLAGANSIEWVVTFWACLRHGWVLVPANAWWSREELAYAAGLVDAQLAVADGRRRERLPKALPCVVLESILTQQLTDGSTVEELPPVPAPSTEDDPAMVLFTSGTTSFPRGAVLSHRNLLANLQNLLAIAGRLPGSPGAARNPAITLMAMPLFHIGGLQQVFTALLSGGTLVFSEGRFSPERVLEVIAEAGVTGWAAVPTMLSRVLEVFEQAPDRYDVSTLRTLVIGGSQVGESLRARARTAFPHTATKGLGTSYGLTEMSGVAATAAGPLVAARPGTVGRPLPTVDVRIEPVEGAEAGVGEVLVRSPGVMLGYWGCDDDPTLTPDRWLRTGDLGRLDDEGYLYIVGRAKDVVIRGGENISAVRVEERLAEHPAVREVAVVGLPHRDLGEELAAAVVRYPGVDIDERGLAAFAAETLSDFAVPTAWQFLDELPKNATGKVLKNQVANTWCGERLQRPS